MNVNIRLPNLASKEGMKFLWDFLQESRNPDFYPSIKSNEISFLCFCLSNFHLSNSQFLQDLYVAYKLNSKKSGFFVDFGATDGISGNNSYLLEKTLDWNGVVAEPVALHHDTLAKNRKCAVETRCVWTKSNTQMEFTTTQHPDFSTIAAFKDSDYLRAVRTEEAGAKTVLVETISLNDLLKNNNAPFDFDYLSIDTEGSEFDILESLDYSTYKPKIITVEHNNNVTHRNKLYSLLVSKGYCREFEIFSDVDDWYYSGDLK